MAGLNLTSITPRRTPPDTESHEEAYLDQHADFEPVLLEQLQEDLTRSRFREGLWISLVVHLVLLILVYTAPRWMPRHAAVLMTEADLMREKDLTYLEMPKDLQRTVKPP